MLTLILSALAVLFGITLPSWRSLVGCYAEGFVLAALYWGSAVGLWDGYWRAPESTAAYIGLIHIIVRLAVIDGRRASAAPSTKQGDFAFNGSYLLPCAALFLLVLGGYREPSKCAGLLAIGAFTMSGGMLRKWKVGLAVVVLWLAFGVYWHTELMLKGATLGAYTSR